MSQAPSSSAFRFLYTTPSPNEPPAPIHVPANEPLSPLSDLSPSPPAHSSSFALQQQQMQSQLQAFSDQSQQTPRPHAARTRQASGASTRPSLRVREAANAASPATFAQVQPARRIRPLALSAFNLPSAPDAPNAAPHKAIASIVNENGDEESSAGLNTPAGVLEFPPRDIVLYSDDANSKVLAAMYRAFMSVDNRAMTVKDLADLSMKHGLVCQHASAAAQAITFFIRSHLNRCEVEDDFPLILRHVLSGTLKDDDLIPALYSRTGGNVTTKDKAQKDENSAENPDRLTSFRRGTVVWYLSKAVGAPCPFARAGIALRDYADFSAITGGESRKGPSREVEPLIGSKRKREGLRKRAPNGAIVEDDSACEGRKPAKVTLRVKPCMTSIREKTGPDGDEDTSSTSDSESGSDAGSMDVDSPVQPETTSSPEEDAAWIFPPYPIQRRISIPPYTPSEETYPTVMQSPCYTTSGFEWRPKLELRCVDDTGPPMPGNGSYYNRDRAVSMPFSVASPPPESDDDFGIDDDEDDDASFTMSPEIPIKREDDAFSYVWPQAAPSNSSLSIKTEYDDTFDLGALDDEAGSNGSKRSSTHTIKDVKREELEIDFGMLNLNFDADTTVKQEDLDFQLLGSAAGSSWNHPVDLSQDEPICGSATSGTWVGAEVVQSDWRNVQLLGPDSVCIDDLEDGGWDSVANAKVLPEPHEDGHASFSLSPEATFRVLDYGSPGSPPSLAESGHTWSTGSPETDLDSAGPASPPSFDSPDSPVVVPHDHSRVSLADTNDLYMGHSAPWNIPGKAQGVGPRNTAVASVGTNVSDSVLGETGAPWERGMVCAEDVEEHLREPAVPSLDMRIVTPSSPPASALSPLTPAEEAVFQSLCLYPEADVACGEEPSSAQEDAAVVAEEIARAIRASTTPPEEVALRPVTRGRRGGTKRAAGIEKRERTVTDENSVAKMTRDAGIHVNSTALSKEVPGKDIAPAKGPLRRSKRVANAVAIPRKSERIRKRTGTA